MSDLLIDPACRANRCAACPGDACEHDCHAAVEVLQVGYRHPTYGLLATASLVPTAGAPHWQVEPVGQGASAVARVTVDSYEEATAVLARMGAALTDYLRACNAARRAASAAMRPEPLR